MSFNGGCFCGAIRFHSNAEPVDTGYCHCSICRKTTGATVVAFASFPVANFRYTKGQPTILKSSAHGQREFCRACGTQVCYRDNLDPITVDVNLGALDDINSLTPNMHIHTNSQVQWLSITDELPRYPAGKSPEGS